MPESRKPEVLDGLTVVRMVRHAGAPPAKPSASKPPAAAPVEPKKAFRGHTVVPERHPIRCYECGYEFFLTVRVQSTYCPKCRKTLALTDHRIEGESTESIKTAGTIRIEPGSVVKGGELLANDIILMGRVEGGRLDAYRRLELGPGAEPDFDLIRAPNLRVAAGAAIRIKGAAVYHDVDILGELTANLQASGRVTIHAGGVVKGRLEGEHLVVEEGGGLKAAVSIRATATR